MGALEHRQHQSVDDPDQGDHDGQGQQDIDQAELLVDRGLLGVLVLGAGLADVGVGVEVVVQSAPDVAGAGPVLTRTPIGSGLRKWDRKKPAPTR